MSLNTNWREIAYFIVCRVSVQGFVRLAEMQRRKITVSDDEAAEEMKNVNETASAAFKKDLPRFRAIHAAVVAMEKDASLTLAQAHERYLSEVMTFRQWEVEKQTYDRRPMREFLDKLVRDESILVNNLESARRGAMEKKLDRAIDQELAGASRQFRIALGKASNFGKASDSESVQAHLFVERERYKWWAARYAAAKIEVLDPKFEDVVEILRRQSQTAMDFKATDFQERHPRDD
jgi:hypothetical protein